MTRRLAVDEGFVMLELRIVLILVGLVLIVPIASFGAMRKGASDASARSNLRAAAALVEAHQLQYGTYAGLTSAGLERLPRPDRTRFVLTDLSATTYCISSAGGGRSWMKVGPAGPIVRGTCS